MEIAIKVLSIIGTIWAVLQVYQALYIIGFFKKTKFNKTENYHKLGICIAARNEEKVIKNLLDSIKNQDYPHDKITIFVVADNCTDGTAQIVREFAKTADVETIVYEHNNPDERTKGYALRYLFDEIRTNVEGGIAAYDGYFVFDADNVLNPDYVTRMNEAFDAGNEIVTSFRNTKNWDQNWISFQYALHWIRTCAIEHRGKNILGLSCRIQGTGFLFVNKFVENGWNYVSLTEDRAFCTDVVVKGSRVAYCEAAKFYDEQPYKLKIALRQRIRWAKGHLQSAAENCPKLIKNIFKFNKNSVRSYDTFWLNFPGAVESMGRKIVTWILQIIIGILAANVWGTVVGIIVGILWGYLGFWVARIIVAIAVCVLYRKDVPKIPFHKLAFYIFMCPFFDKIGDWSMYIALFKKVEWKQIPHDFTVDVDKLKDNNK